MREYAFLGIAIASEIVGTASLKLADGFTNPVPSLVVAVGYLGSFYFLNLTLQDLPIGLVYATWSAVGIVGAAAIGVAYFDESLDAAGVAGICLILAGVALLNLFSDAYAPAH
jgi:small multidrug resistance pump